MEAGRRAGALAAVLAAGGLALTAPAAAAAAAAPAAAAGAGGGLGGAARQLDGGFRASVELGSDGESFRVLLEKNLTSGEAAGGWVGFGVADQTSGHMLGSDIATLHFDGGEGAPSLVDRHVPWAAHPFGPADLFPVPDVHGDWFLESYEFAEVLDGAEGEPGDPVAAFSAVLSRALVTGDPYDNDVGAEWDSLLAVWAYGATPGGEVGYHGARRGATMLPLGREAAAPALPVDAEGSTDLLFSEYSLPTTLDTYYACQSFDLSGGPRRHIVALEPLIQSKEHVHHIVVHRCRPGEFVEAHREPVACNPGNAREGLDAHGGDSPAGASGGACSGLVYVWAAGAGLFVLPEEAGIPIGGTEDSHLVVEIHYDNPEKTPGVVDSSGFRLHWAESRLREHDAATMVVGDALVARDTDLPAGVAEEHRQCVCPRPLPSPSTNPPPIYPGKRVRPRGAAQPASTRVDGV